MKILPYEQGTPEAFAFRRTKIGASDIAVIMAGTLREQYELYQEKVSGKEKFVTEAMMRGSVMEEEAIAWLFGTRKKIIRPLVQNELCDWLIASLDAYHPAEKVMAEIKCPGLVPDRAEDYPRFKKAYWQCQAQMYCTGLGFTTLLIYSPLRQTKSVIQRNDADISLLLEKGHEFYERIAFRNPPPAPPELPVREDDDAVGWARMFREIDERQKEIDEAKKLLRDEGISLAGDQPFECEGVVVQRVAARESIDYKAACTAHGIDLSKYKKLPAEPFTWRISAP